MSNSFITFRIEKVINQFIIKSNYDQLKVNLFLILDNEKISNGLLTFSWTIIFL
jgi:hypothetical protein